MLKLPFEFDLFDQLKHNIQIDLFYRIFIRPIKQRLFDYAQFGLTPILKCIYFSGSYKMFLLIF